MSIKKNNSESLQINDEDESDFEEKSALEEGKPIEGNIMVFVRVRPLNQKEIANQEFDILRVDKQLLIVMDPVSVLNDKKKANDIFHRSKEHRYGFDLIFRENTQEEIFEITCKPLISSVLQGFNCTVFAYGPTVYFL